MRENLMLDRVLQRVIDLSYEILLLKKSISSIEEDLNKGNLNHCNNRTVIMKIYKPEKDDTQMIPKQKY